MPIVFVHGVATRKGAAYEAATRVRTALIRSFLLPSLYLDVDKVKFWNPYWGDNAADFAWNHASLPRGNEEKFGPGDALPALLLSEMWQEEVLVPDRIVLGIARRSMADAIDILWATAFEHASDTELSALADLAVQAMMLAKREPAVGWVNTASDDQEFLQELARELTAASLTVSEETLGPRRSFLRLREGLGRIARVAGRMTSTVAVDSLRMSINQSASMFIGDILVYLRQRETAGMNGAISKIIADDLDRAARARDSHDPTLVVIAHSMGGNIVYDLFSNLRTDLSCEVLLTVGSQVGVFAELGLFPAVAPASDPSESRVPELTNVTRWINVFDPNDVLAFIVGSIFEGAEDYRYSTGYSILAAHSGYFVRPSFYDRLATRLSGER